MLEALADQHDNVGEWGDVQTTGALNAAGLRADITVDVAYGRLALTNTSTPLPLPNGPPLPSAGRAMS